MRKWKRVRSARPGGGLILNMTAWIFRLATLYCNMLSLIPGQM